MPKPKKKSKSKKLKNTSEFVLDKLNTESDYMENNSDSEIYYPKESLDNNYDDDDNLDDDKNEIEDEDFDNETNENNETEMDDCFYKSAKIYTDSDNDNILNDMDKESKEEKELKGENRITEPIMTKYEYVRIVGNRAKQIALGSKKFIKNVDNLSAKEIAILELKYKMVPFKIKRPLPNNYYEIWKIQELEIPVLN